MPCSRLVKRLFAYLIGYKSLFFLILLSSLILHAWLKPTRQTMRLSSFDPNSFSEPEKIILRHVDLDWTVDFDSSTIKAKAKLDFRVVDKPVEGILLDVSEIKINSIAFTSSAGKIPLAFVVSDHVENIGSKLAIDLPAETTGDVSILIEYETSPNASALQWLQPEQTAGKVFPYLFSQCQAIHARSVLPCQDTPGVKFTYNAVLRHPTELTGLMSAIRVKSEPGVTQFQQKVPIPAYLLAIAVGALVSKPIGPISDVWAEKEQIDEAAEEFSDTNSFLEKASAICGPYVWKRYDLLVMPPSFPFGGMENPCLTFVTPTVIAGDKSLVDVVAHEISHSWTGNLVTNRNFEHFWLNEGFTVFVEGKILGRLRGEAYRDFHSIHGLSELTDTINSALKDQPELTKLVVDLSNLGPDDAFSSVPYIKGSTFLRYLEDLFGGPNVFEPFFRRYLDKFKFKSILTEDFKNFVWEYFKDTKPEALNQIDWEKWLYSEGMPPIIPKYDTSMSDVCNKHAELWANNPLDMIQLSLILELKLTSPQKIEFLAQLLESPHIVDLDAEKIDFLSKNYGLDETKNFEIRFRYLRLCIRARLKDKIGDILNFVNSNFRMKFIRPVYRELGQWPEAKPLAVANFEKVKNQMMKVAALGVAKDLGLDA